jgi:urea transport system permease protein
VLAPYWLFMLGGLFIAVTLLLPRGIVGTIEYWINERRVAARSANSVVNADLPEPAPRPAE